MGSTERLTDIVSVALVPARQGHDEDGLLTFRLVAATSQTMADELGWWAARHLALDYFAGLGGSLGLRSIDTAEYFLPDGGHETNPRQGAHIALRNCDTTSTRTRIGSLPPSLNPCYAESHGSDTTPDYGRPGGTM